VHLQRQAAWLCLKTGFEHHTPASACMGTITTQIFEYPILCYLLNFLSVHTRDLSWFYKPPGRPLFFLPSQQFQVLWWIQDPQDKKFFLKSI
jgi:hypothetical protein